MPRSEDTRGDSSPGAAPADLALRGAQPEDARRILEWRNRGFVRERSTDTRAIRWETHVEWFARALEDPDRCILVVSEAERECGVVRFDRVAPPVGVISVFLDEAFSGRGLGPRAIAAACDEIFGRWDIARVVACVRADNPLGRRAFHKAGFAAGASGHPCPERHVALSRERPVSGAGR